MQTNGLVFPLLSFSCFSSEMPTVRSGNLPFKGEEFKFFDCHPLMNVTMFSAMHTLTYILLSSDVVQRMRKDASLP